ncbi:hypothetical protein AAVH_16537 [Aphelenchoides avenae]|nr:hypothetical protein AAVH_16537 [Aphelenchus avenae]
MKALSLFLTFVACAFAYCPPPFRWRHFVYAKGHAKVKIQSQEVTKGLRVELVSYYPNDPKNVTALAEADADDSGFYVIAGSSLVGCYFRKQYALRLYADKLTTFPLEVDKYGKNDRIDVPEEYVLREDQPVKIFEKDIEARIIIVP